MNNNIAKPAVPARWQIHKRLYNWVLGWADHKYGPLIMVTVALVEPIFLPVPADLLLIAMCLAKPKKALRYGLLVAAFSVLGGCLAFGLGLAIGGQNVSEFFHALKLGPLDLGPKADMTLQLYNRFSFWAVATSALTPVPYMLFSWLGGFAGISFYLFAVTSIIFRSLRFGSEAVLIYFLGERAKPLIDKYFNLICCAVIALLAGVFLLTKMITHYLVPTG
ncbi:MAG: DedA family protein [Phycisphaerae bacterium]|nr:DedA family protein [Phycisphaerae bacterium]